MQMLLINALIIGKAFNFLTGSICSLENKDYNSRVFQGCVAYLTNDWSKIEVNKKKTWIQNEQNLIKIYTTKKKKKNHCNKSYNENMVVDLREWTTFPTIIIPSYRITNKKKKIGACFKTKCFNNRKCCHLAQLQS